jgi:hypothetical protein
MTSPKLKAQQHTGHDLPARLFDTLRKASTQITCQTTCHEQKTAVIREKTRETNKDAFVTVRLSIVPLGTSSLQGEADASASGALTAAVVSCMPREKIATGKRVLET